MEIKLIMKQVLKNEAPNNSPIAKLDAFLWNEEKVENRSGAPFPS